MSGAAALILQQHPSWTNNQVKALLTTTAKLLTAGTKIQTAQGKGTLDLTKALGVTSVTAAYSYTNSTGSGSLESARGSAHLVDNGVVLNGEKDIFGSAVSTSTLASKRTAGTAWTGGTYNGQVWTGSGFSGTDWTAATWSGRMWSGDGWSGNTWSSAGWN